MPPASQKGIKVEIMGQQHQFACPQGQEDALLKAAKQLDKMFWDIKQRSGIRNNDRALLMAALNLSNELALANQTLETNQQQLNSLVSSLNDALTEK
ncbi:cell division protein ZapA [Pseudoalteromonas denitrificans]|uniref:Cell division protein ZapA n=1 Tax=Pseudoalteromonas denitrificans DSM 6059 TaxID=1123010 RepID=A0A1I1JI56_9GAMM|nr:cell division protein ZapA [Pseudoalteromonas denitrificans]SFC45140.1 cell division protein ZapA [Pseudoalteromonas denitrificans DSM 6059]